MRFDRWILLLLALGILLAGGAATAQELKIGGTGNALGSMRLMAEAFVKKNPDIKVTVLPSIGSSGAFKAVPKGALDIGLVARSLSDEERKMGMVAVEYARSPLVFVVGANSKTKGITLEQVADIFSGRMANWPEGGQVRPVMRQAGNDETGLLKKMSPALEKAVTDAEQRPGLPFATTDQESADKVESIPGAFGISTLSLMISEKRTLRALALDGVEPTAVNGASGKYPLLKRFFYITQASPSPAVKRFLEFSQSAQGREVLARAGNWIP